jgi:glutamyl-Q tRNA(Asp) synthetase
MTNSNKPYIGRFAPSPSGELHFGSLIAALGSYLRARSQQGIWRIRIDDIDTTRCIKNADSQILSALEHLGFTWDGAVTYQHQHTNLYAETLERLLNNNQAYGCQCSRRKLKNLQGVYNGACRFLKLDPNQNGIRFRNTVQDNAIFDSVQGQHHISLPFAAQDFTLKRRDGIISYNLAVVIDDIEQGITEVVRGADLLDSTIHQQQLYLACDYPYPKWLHLPLALDISGYKLSKQNKAKPLDLRTPQKTLIQALNFLNQPTFAGMEELTPTSILRYSIANFDVQSIPKKRK